MTQQENKPLFFLRAGLLSSAPRHFLNALTTKYNAALISPSAIREEFRNKGASTHESNTAIGLEMDTRVAELLYSRKNIVHDGLLNTKRRRDHMRAVAANVGGATIILMQIDTDPDIVYERLGIKYPNEPGVIARKQKFVRETQIPQLELPENCGEEHLKLNGARSVSELLGTIDTYIQKIQEEA